VPLCAPALTHRHLPYNTCTDLDGRERPRSGQEEHLITRGTCRRLGLTTVILGTGTSRHAARWPSATRIGLTVLAALIRSRTVQAKNADRASLAIASR
jgi:hypothetical protein